MKKKVGIIDLGLSNLGSICNAVKFCKAKPILIRSFNEIQNYDHIILPGIGSYNLASKIIKKKKLKTYLKNFFEKKGKFFGICLGMQLMFESSNEYGDSKGMGFFKGKVSKFRGMKIKIPHVGFNIVKHDNHKIWKGIPRESKFYFVHSYKINKRIDQKKIKYLNCNYSRPFIAFVRNGNIFASQFHPEKSGGYGIKLLKNFINF